MIHEPVFTLSAGPTMSSRRVNQALGSGMVFDYDPAFQEVFRETEASIAELLKTKQDVVIFQAEAYLGIEGACRSLARPGMKCLNVVTGVYGQWFGDRLRSYGAEVDDVVFPFNEAADPAVVGRRLEELGDRELVSVVHSETPSGIVNPLAEIAALGKQAGALVFSDVVSSVGGTEMWPDEWGVDLCVVGAQKCLAGPSGIAFAVVSDAAWEAISTNPDAPRRSFLSLLDWKERWIEGGREAYPYTPTVSEILGLHAAVREVLDAGLDSVVRRHDIAAEACRRGAEAMGLELWPRDEAYAANCVTAITCPDGIDVQATLRHVRRKYGVMLSGGYGDLRNRLFRIGHMGPATQSLYPLVAVTALGRGLADLGVKLDIGAGADAVLASLAGAFGDEEYGDA
jgi:pyridoxamine--pyruvate transaminase